ncbi:tyrosine-type recombinase/integrase [Bifidobacterium catulorum]|uniref:Site-specific integrase n=1 Tax=Bifidobacterium catulorum TaxID=1630173 RepID=A0A2U2MUH0_9BIFI|nr:site-specific integrase [Bifidobacterium catulorum]PWG60511.1 site-specific integrase [Bifidobacterium catulorum]
MTLDDFWPRWWASCKMLRESTLIGYESAYRLHLRETFGHVPLDAITVERVESWAAAYADRPGACRKAWAVLRSMLRKAAKWGVIAYDPCSAGVGLPSPKPYEPKTIGIRDVKRMLRHFHGHRIEAYAIVSAVLGLRRGEACGIEWEDIDLRKGQVRIRRSVQYVHGRTITVQPKTRLSHRTLPLPRFVVERLRQIRRTVHGRGRLTGTLTPLQVARRFRSHMRLIGLGHIPPSNLRHSWATNALTAGVDLKVVSAMLGHSDIGTTAKYYLRPTWDVYRQAMKTIGASILNA